MAHISKSRKSWQEKLANEGIARVKQRLDAEGHQVVRRSKCWFVADSEQKLYRPCERGDSAK